MKRLLWRIRYVVFGVTRRMDLRTAWYCSGCVDDWQEVRPSEACLYEIELSWRDA